MGEWSPNAFLNVWKAAAVASSHPYAAAVTHCGRKCHSSLAQHVTHQSSNVRPFLAVPPFPPPRPQLDCRFLGGDAAPTFSKCHHTCIDIFLPALNGRRRRSIIKSDIIYVVPPRPNWARSLSGVRFF